MNKKKYYYKEKNLTTLILSKIEHVVNILAENETSSFEDCYRKFLLSRTYRNLLDTDTLLWGESAEFIADDYYREIGDAAD